MNTNKSLFQDALLKTQPRRTMLLFYNDVHRRTVWNSFCPPPNMLMPRVPCQKLDHSKFIELVVPRCTLTGVDKHVSVEWALRAENFAADCTGIGRRLNGHQVVWADVLRQVMVAWQLLLAYWTLKRLLSIVTSIRQYLQHKRYLHVPSTLPNNGNELVQSW